MPEPLRIALSADPRAALYWRTVLALLLAVVTWLALTPAPPPAAVLLWDKLNHLAAFASLAVAGYMGLQRRWVQVALGLLAYGVLIEILQSFTATRVGEWVDLVADGIGIGLGLLLAAAMARLAAPRRAVPGRPDAQVSRDTGDDAQCGSGITRVRGGGRPSRQAMALAPTRGQSLAMPTMRKGPGGGLVYSTDAGRMCPACRQPVAACTCRASAQAQPVGDGRVRVSHETKGRGGKAVTLVRGLPLDAAMLDALGKRLRTACGSGGTAKDGVLEIQGDHVERVLALLRAEGHRAIRAGG